VTLVSADLRQVDRRQVPVRILRRMGDQAAAHGKRHDRRQQLVRHLGHHGIASSIRYRRLGAATLRVALGRSPQVLLSLPAR